jgi:actin-related protein
MMDEAILVVDIGSSSVKAGYSGEDVPSFVFPSTLARGAVGSNLEVGG